MRNGRKIFLMNAWQPSNNFEEANGLNPRSFLNLSVRVWRFFKFYEIIYFAAIKIGISE